jgi:hypothetical protein
MPETEFAYDVASVKTLPEALWTISRPLQDILFETQRRVEAFGRRELARRFAPVWHEDMARAVRQRPRRLLAALGDEARLIDAVVTLGTARDLGMVKPYVHTVLAVLRSFHDCDLRELAAPLLAETTKALEREMDRTARPTGEPAGDRPIRSAAPRYLTTSTGSETSSVRGGRHMRSLQA